MNLKQIARLAVVVVVAAAVVVVLRLKQTESTTSLDGPHDDAAFVVRETSLRPDDPSPANVVLPKLLDLGADKCIPCKKMAPILVALREDFSGQFDVVFIDVWKDRQAAVPYRISVIPTQVFFDEAGNELFRHQGFYSRDDILSKWSELGYAFAPPPGSDAG